MRQETKFTPGPWFPIDYCGYINLQSVDFYEEKNNLLDAESCGAYEANGALAAAAPDLYEALRFIAEGHPFEAADIAKAALAKLTPPSNGSMKQNKI